MEKKCGYQIVGIGPGGERVGRVSCGTSKVCLRNLVWGKGDEKGLGVAGAYDRCGGSPAVNHLVEGDCGTSMESLVFEPVAKLDEGALALANLADKMIASIEDDINRLKSDLGL